MKDCLDPLVILTKDLATLAKKSSSTELGDEELSDSEDIVNTYTDESNDQESELVPLYADKSKKISGMQ